LQDLRVKHIRAIFNVKTTPLLLLFRWDEIMSLWKWVAKGLIAHNIVASFLEVYKWLICFTVTLQLFSPVSAGYRRTDKSLIYYDKIYVVGPQ
jgi:hypothetical protein